MPTLADLTTEQITQSVRRSLITEYGDQWWTYPIAVKANAAPMVVVYERNNATYRRPFTIEFVGDFPNAILGGEEAEVVAQTVYVDVPANFSAPEGDAAMVSWSGLLFKGGDYGAKGKYGPPELEKFVESFPPNGVPIKDSHVETFFGMCLADHDARVSKVWLSDDKNLLHGTFEAPSWAAEAAKKRVKSVSIGLTDDRAALKEVSLTINPHVEDAAVWEKELARAVVTAPTFSAFAALHPEGARLVTEAAKAPVPTPAMLTQEQKTQEAKQAYAALPQFMRDAQTESQFIAFALTQETPAPTVVKADPAIQAQIDDIKKTQDQQGAQFAAQQDADDAAKFFLEELKAGRRTPADEKDVKAEFSLARGLDRAKGVTFSAEGSAETDLRKRYAEKPVVFNYAGHLPSHADVPAPKGLVYGGLDAHFAAEDASKETK